MRFSACCGMIACSIIFACGRFSAAEKILAAGTVVPRMEVTLSSREPSEVVQVLVSESHRVARGDMLIKLDPRRAELTVREGRARLEGHMAEIRVAEIESKMAEVAERHARQKLAQLRRLAKDRPEQAGRSNSELQLTVIEAESQIALAELRRQLIDTQMVQKRAQLEATKSQLQLAEIRLEQTRIMSPFDGIVSRIHSQPGTTHVEPGAPLITIMDPSPVVEINLPALQVQRLASKGVTVIASGPKAPRKYAGKIARLASRVDTATQTIRAIIHLAPPEDGAPALMPGLIVQVRLELDD